MAVDAAPAEGAGKRTDPFHTLNYTTREITYGHRNKVISLKWNCTGKRLATGSNDKSVRIWTPELRASVKNSEKSDVEFRGHQDAVNNVAWHPTNPDMLASTSFDKTVRVWDAKSSKVVAAVATPGANLFMAWSPDGAHLAVINRDNVLSLIDTRRFKTLRPVTFKSDVNELCWSADSKHMYLPTEDGLVELREVVTGGRDGAVRAEPVVTLAGHFTGTKVLCTALSRDGKQLASGGSDGLVTMWDLSSLVCARCCWRLDSAVRSVAWSHDAAYLAVTTEKEANIDVVSTATGEGVTTIPLREPCDAVAWNPAGLVLAYAGDMHPVGQDRRDFVGAVGLFAPP